LLPNVAKTHVTFPKATRSRSSSTTPISFPATKQVRYYYANKAAVAAAKAGKAAARRLGAVRRSVCGEARCRRQAGHGRPTATSSRRRLVAYTAMGADAGWGNDIPEMLRNENWNYAVFTTDKQHRPGVNQPNASAATSRSTKSAIPSR